MPAPVDAAVRRRQRKQGDAVTRALAEAAEEASMGAKALKTAMDLAAAAKKYGPNVEKSGKAIQKAFDLYSNKVEAGCHTTQCKTDQQNIQETRQRLEDLKSFTADYDLVL